MAKQRTMKAAVVEKFGEPLVVREVPIPAPGPGQALVEIVATGVCHTDLHAAEGDWPVKPSPPFTPGHEGAGIVAALGPGVSHLKEGDRVGIAWLHSACGHCDFCLGWVGNAVRATAQFRLLGGWLLRAICTGEGRLSGTDSKGTLLH
jgi:D-arabinose 1-dehydrogenase-like Zn-dependent alcohol dehydrogenase